MDTEYKPIIRWIINTYNETGVKWKITESMHFGQQHLEKRQRRKDIETSWSLDDYNNLILHIINGMGNDVHLYYLVTFEQNYFTFDDGEWIVMVGQNGVMETAMKGNPLNYFTKNPGYSYLGKVKEVFV